MMKVTLVYPYFHPSNDNSIFRFPPLGLGYLAAVLRKRGVQVEVVDCTFIDQKDALRRIILSHPTMVGIYSMFSLRKASIEMARHLKNHCDLLVAGGPLPSLDPYDFLQDFDVVIVGEGEETILSLAEATEKGQSLSQVKGIVYNNDGKIRTTPQRGFVKNLDSLPFPARDLFENEAYKQFYKKRLGYTTTSMITSRGCPFRCDFCSRPIFGNDFRTRSPENIVEEIDSIASMGYERVWFSDDCFTFNRQQVIKTCEIIKQKGIHLGWECLSRVDTMDQTVAKKMKEAGCIRVFFGIESGNNDVLRLMNKSITTQQATNAVRNAKREGLQVGAFFILGYPGETDQTVLDTVNYASSLKLDYLSFTLPYPIPGTPLHERVKDNGGIHIDNWEEPRNYSLIRHKLLYGSKFSENKLKFAIGKGQLQHYTKKYLGEKGYFILGTPIECVSDVLFRLIR
jgi:anaerobic magnesium-protoporphyrin IX monomethyl ester cyclase